MDLSAFKAYDIRGSYPGVIDEELAYRVGRGLVRYLSAKNIVVGRDMRSSGSALKERLIEGISCEGADVFDIDLCSTPMLTSAVIDYGYDGGVMISASHSPGNENGFKLIDSRGIQIGEGLGLEEVKKIVKRGFPNCPGRGAVTEKNVLGDYISKMIDLGSDLKDLRVVVDYSSGVGSVPARPLFARLSSIEVTELNSEPDDTFPAHPANPHDIKNLKQLQEEVKRAGADVGLFFDGDADRVQAVDEKGRVVPMDLLFCLLAEKELEKESNRGKRYYFDLRFSKVVPEIIEGLGGEPVMMRVGNPFYKKALSDSGVLAAEFSGHVMYTENNGIDDGLFCALKILKMLNGASGPLSAMTKEIRKYSASDEISLEAESPRTVFDRLRAELTSGREIELDGFYLDLKDGFVSVRQSQSEPHLFRVRVEAETEEKMKKRLEKVLKIVGARDKKT